MLKRNELDINYFIELAEKKIGYIGDLNFQSDNKYGDIAGTFEILSFEKLSAPTFTYSFWKYEKDDTPNGADLGYFTIKLTNTKFYNGKTFKFKVSAYVQDSERGVNDMLYISNVNAETGKQLKAYSFPILDWINK